MTASTIGWLSLLGVFLLVLVAVFQSRPGVREKLSFMCLFITGCAGVGFAVYAAMTPYDPFGEAANLLVACIAFTALYLISARRPRE